MGDAGLVAVVLESCDHTDRSPPGSSGFGTSPGKDTAVGCIAFSNGHC